MRVRLSERGAREFPELKGREGKIVSQGRGYPTWFIVMWDHEPDRLDEISYAWLEKIDA